MKDVQVQEEKEPFDPRRPLRFSTSPAGHFNLRHYRLEPDPIDDAPWYKIVIITGTIAFTLIYGMFYKQRSRLDEELETPLGKRVLQIKEHHTLKDRNYALRNGLPTKQFDDELELIQMLRK